MNFLRDLTSESSSLVGGSFVELEVVRHDPSSPDLLLCKSARGGNVSVRFRNGIPPMVDSGAFIAIWEFVRDASQKELIIDLDLKGHSSWVVRQPSPNAVSPRFAEFCCGLGGWTQGLRILMGKEDFKPLMLLDYDSVVAKACAKTLGMDFLTLQQAYDLICGGRIPLNVVIHGDLLDKRSWCVLGFMRVHHLCMSTPCPPWSGAARALGLAAKDGRALAFAVYMARIVGVKVIELENVPAIVRHDHFPDLKAFFVMQGFSLTHSGTYEVFPLLPLKRERWIAALVKEYLRPPVMASQWVENVKFPKISFGPPQLAHRDCVHDFLCLYEVQELTPQTNAFLKMSNLQYLPKSMKHKQGQSVLMSRCIGPQDHMVAVMACYGKQHELPDDILKEKGMFTVLYFDKEKSIAPRYLSPWEIISTMAWPDSLHLPCDIHDCWKAVGNSITIPHVILGLFKTHAALLEKSPWGEVIFSLSELLERASSKRICLSQVQQSVGDTRFLVSKNLSRNSGAPATAQDTPSDFSASNARQPPIDGVLVESRSGLLEVFPNENRDASVPAFVVPVNTPSVVAAVVGTAPFETSSRRVSRDPLWDAVQEVALAHSQNNHIDDKIEHGKKGDEAPPNVKGDGSCELPKNPLKRVWNDDDTWCFEESPHGGDFKGPLKENFHRDPSDEQWKLWGNLFDDAINKSGINRIWPMARILMVVSGTKGWYKITAVEHQMSVLSMIQVVLPHALPKHFSRVLVDGHEVTPTSVPPGLHKVIIACQMNPFTIEVSLPNEIVFKLEGDVTLRGMDVLKKVEAMYDLHSSCIKLSADKRMIQPGCYIAALGSCRFEVKNEAVVTLPGDIPTVQMPCGLPFPPDHSDLSMTPVPSTIRVAARHLIWSSVRTVLVPVDESIQSMLYMLFPDMKTSCQMSLCCGIHDIDEFSRVKTLNFNSIYEINFGTSKPLPVAVIEFITPMSIVDQMQIGTQESAGPNPIKRWVRSPFQSKPFEKYFRTNQTLVNLAAQYMAHSTLTQSMLTLVNGKCVDPRICIDQVAHESVITIRCCPLVGCVKKNEDIKKMLHQQLIARGVHEESIQARIESILSCVPADKLRTFVSETWSKQWDGIKNLANEGKIRLVTVEELKSFQKSKKAERAHDEKSTAASSNTNSTGPSVKSSVSNLARKSSLHEVNVDLSYFKAGGMQVAQLSAESFGPDAQGAAIMHFESAQRFLPPTKLSPEHLAIIAIGNVNSNLKGTSDFRMIPATDAVGSPILVPATIINYGDVPVTFEERNSAKIDSQAAMVIEFTIWKNEIELWSTTKSPMLFLGQCFPEMKHSTIMGSWAIKFFTCNKKQVDHATADYIHGFFRVLETDVDSLLTRSGWNGTYFTPKNEVKKPHPDYMVINVPNHDIHQMKALAQKTVNSLGIVKMPQNLALRCRREHGHLVMKAVFPDLPQPDIGHFEQGDDLFILKHVNFNVKASELSSALQNLGWEGAKAIRPVGSTAWMIASKCQPPSAHLCLNGNFVVVVPHQKSAGSAPKGPQVPNTAAFKANLAADTPMVSPADKGTSRLDEIKSSMQSQVQAMIDARLANHSSQIEQLQYAVQASARDVQALKEGQCVAEQRIVGVEQAVQVSTSSLLNQMTSMFTNLQSALSDRLDKFEARYDPEEKRQRTS